MAEKSKTFKIPLVGPKQNIAAPNCTFDFKDIARQYRERLGGNPFGILPDPEPDPQLSFAEDG